MKYVFLLFSCIAANIVVAAENVIIHPLEQQTIGYYAVVLPPDYNAETAQQKTYPVCISIHGSGRTEQDVIGFAKHILGSEGVIYLSARAPHPKNSVFLKKQPGFTAWPEYHHEKDSSIKVPETLQVDKMVIERYYTNWIADCLQDVRKRYRTDNEKVVVLGHSQGGAFGLRFALDYPQFVKAVFLAAGYYESRLETSEAGKILRENDIFVFFTHNKDDPVVDFKQSELLLKYLEDNEVAFDYKFYPDGGHKFRREAIQLAKEFVDKWCRQPIHLR